MSKYPSARVQIVKKNSCSIISTSNLNITCQLIPPALKAVTKEKLGESGSGKCWVMFSDHGDGCSLIFLISRHLGKHTFPFLLPPAILIGKC